MSLLLPISLKILFFYVVLPLTINVALNLILLVFSWRIFEPNTLFCDVTAWEIFIQSPLLLIKHLFPPIWLFGINVLVTRSSCFQILVSRNLIPCKSNKNLSLCHACQLGKHTRLPFWLSDSTSTFPFQLIHSDVWTSPITSVSGIKYYVILLDNFLQFIWGIPFEI